MTRTIIKTGAMVILFLLTFWIISFVVFPILNAHAEARYYADTSTRTYNPAARFILPTSPPEGCTPIEASGEGFPRVQCPDGVWYRDMDGQIWANDEGHPIYPPGTWVPELAPR